MYLVNYLLFDRTISWAKYPDGRKEVIHETPPRRATEFFESLEEAKRFAATAKDAKIFREYLERA